MSIHVNNVSLYINEQRGWWGQERTTILDAVSFVVPKGRITVLLGASGIGKTLLARAILRVLPEGVQMTGEICRPRQVAYLPQSISHLDPTTRIKQQLSGHRANLPENCLSRYPHQISGGEAKRALAALMPEAYAVVADEPTAGLDADTATQVLENLKERALMGAAVLVISHDLRSIFPFADDVLLLSDQRLIAHHAASDFTGEGDRLSQAARRYWRAMPENGFHDA